MANNRNRRHKKPEIGAGYRPPFAEDVLAQPVDVLDIRPDTFGLLQGAGVLTMNDVLIRQEKDFYRILTFNKKNLLDVKFALKRKNLFLRPSPEENKDAKPEEGKKDAKKNNNNNNNKQEKNSNQKQQKGKADRPQQSEKKEKEEADIYVKVNKGGKWGFKDREGNQKVEPVYDEVYSFKEDLCCVEKDEKFGFINREGEEVVPLVYDVAVSFSEGYACVYKGEKCGYINKANETIIDFKYDAGTPVIGGECRVKRDGKWGELHIDNPTEIRWIN